MSHHVRPTRYPELGYTQVDTRLWRIVDLSTSNLVGPSYPTMRELLADLERFATVFGCNTGNNSGETK
jgi:hypothetical protein